MDLRRAALACLIGCAALTSPARAQELTEAEWAEAMDFAMHDAAFTLYHEIGHLLVGELALPVLGKEEDAADALAAILLLDDAGEDVEAYNTLIDSADGWYFNAVESTGEGVDALSYYDDHSLDIQRAYALVCMMVGATRRASAKPPTSTRWTPNGRMPAATPISRHTIPGTSCSRRTCRTARRQRA